MEVQPRISMQMLKHTGYYIIDEDGKEVHIQFRAEVGQSSFFRVPVARFIWPDKTEGKVTVEPFTSNLLYEGKPLPFAVEYRNAVWYAPLRPRP